MSTIEELQLQIEEMKQMLTAHAGGAWPGAASVGWPHSNQMLAYREIHGPYRMSVDATHPMTFIVDFDSSVRQLYDANLIIKVDKVRSNVSAASAASGGGGTTTSASGGSSTPTTSSGGGQTSSSGGAQTSSSSGAHRHQVASFFGTGTTGTYGNTSGTPSTASTQAQSASHTHNETGGVTGYDNSNHTHSLNSHTHTYDNVTPIDVYYGKTSGGSNKSIYLVRNSTGEAGGDWWTYEEVASHSHTVVDHTHTVSNHDHTVTIGTHTHDVTLANHNHTITMTYGIYEGPAPSTPQITITINGTDRTSALGGPWDDDVTLNVRQYLREGSGNPYWQSNSIVLTSTELIDLEITCKSLVVAAPPFAVGL